MPHINKKEILAQLTAQGIDPEYIKNLHLKLKLGEISYDSFIISKEKIAIPADHLFNFYNQLPQHELKNIGHQAIQNDELLIFWLNGGAATRYFDESKIKTEEKKRYAQQLQKISPAIRSLPKGITPVINAITYLELKIINLLKITTDLKLKKHPPVLIMNSFLTDEPTKKHLNELFKKYPQLIKERFHFVVQQPNIPRFKKVEQLQDMDVFIDQKGRLSFAPSGHGDFLYLTKKYLQTEKITGVKYMFFNNIDNFGSYIDPIILGYHIQKQKGRTVEVARKNPGDKGGAPCLVDGQMQIVEQMKFPNDFNQDTLKYFNTNNFWFTLQDLINYEAELPMIIAEKNIYGQEVLQLEHFACDVNLPSNFLVVPREIRFLPTKRYVDLLIYLNPDKADIAQTKQSEQFKSLLHNHFAKNLL